MYPVTTPPSPTAATVGFEEVIEFPSCTWSGKNERSDASNWRRVLDCWLTWKP